MILPLVRSVDPRIIGVLPADSSGSASIQGVANGQRKVDRRNDARRKTVLTRRESGGLTAPLGQ